MADAAAATPPENPVRLARDYAWLINIAKEDTSGSMLDLMTRLQAYIKKVKGDRTSIQTWVETNLPKTTWAQDRTSKVQQSLIEQNDPRFKQDWNESIQKNRRAIQLAAQNMGAQLDPDELDKLAYESRLNGWDQQQQIDALTKYVTPVKGDYKGNAGTYQDELASWSSANGITMSPSMVAGYVDRLTKGETTVDEIKSDLRKTYMAGAFPAWADKINAGMDIADIAAPYTNTMAQLLEVDPKTVNFNDPLLAKGLQSVGPDGKPRVMPLYEFQNMVRKDSRWQTTNNAYSTYANVAQNVLRTFGFA